MSEIIPDLVTTIIPVYNRPEMIHKAVESVLDQTYRPIEIILVDDGSTDDTPKVLDQIAVENPDVIRVIHKENEGPGLAREAGRLVARGGFIQYLDSDDWLLRNKFEDQVRALREHPECGIAYGVSMYVDDEGNVLNPVSRCTGRKFDYLFPTLLVRRWWYTHTPLFRRSVSDAAGAWPERQPEDWDLEARMGALKTKLVHCESTVSCQCEHASGERVSKMKLEDYLPDEAWFLPRLYHCALKAGVTKGDVEMQKFSRWVFMRARDLGTIGETDAAWKLLTLAEECALKVDWSLRLVKFMARSVGWKITGRLCNVYLRYVY